MDKKRINLEIKILKNTYHFNIIKLYEVIETKDTICIIMEYAEGGELYNYIIEKKYLSEDESRKIFQQIIDAIYYLHQIGICHRDLKLENILFSSNKKDYIKIIDFGLSNLYLTGVNSENPTLAFGADFLETPCGSPGYVPPEMILGCKYDGLLSDIWSSGIILFSMLCGYLPFDDNNEEILYSKIIKGEFFFPDNINISDEAKCLIKKILVVNPRLRANIKDIRKDPWFMINYKPIFGLYISIRDIPISNKIIEEMEKYGFNKDKITDDVKKNKHNKITTFYYLLVNKFKNMGIETENDLISNTYNEYLKTQDLKNKLIKKGEKPISLKIMKLSSKSLFNLKDENEIDNLNNKIDLEYLKKILEENMLNSNDNIDNTDININTQKNEKKESKNKEKKINKNKDKDNINKFSINHANVSQNKKERNNINNIKEIKIENLENKLISKKNKKDIEEKKNIHIHREYKENNSKEKYKKIFDSLDIKKNKNKYSYSTSINKKKQQKKSYEESNIKLSYNKKIKNIEIEDFQKKINKKRKEDSNNKPKKDNKERLIKKINKKLEYLGSELDPKVPKLSLNKYNNKNRIHININSISNNRVNSFINKDILNTINNTNIKINKINKIKDKNLKDAINKNIRKGKYFDTFNKGIISRNYFEVQSNHELKTSRQFKNKYILKSKSNSKSKSKSRSSISKSKSICSSDKKRYEKIYNYEIYKKLNKNKYDNTKINIRKSPFLLTETYKNTKNKNSSLNKENKIKKPKSNSVSKLKNRNKIKSNDNKIKNKKLIKSKEKYFDSIQAKIEIISNKKKIDSIKQRMNDKIKNNNSNVIQKLKINRLKSRNIEEINSNFNTIKSIENQLTERNNRINNIKKNKGFGLIENNINIKKLKNFSSTLQKIIPSLKGITIKEKKPLFKKSLMNLMGNINSNKENDKNNNKEVFQKMNRNKIVKKLNINIDNNKDINFNINQNKTLNKININNNNISTKIRKISPINKNNKFVKSTINNISNLIDNNNNKEISKQNINIKNNIKIKPLKIKEIKSININNYDTNPKTCRRSNIDNKERNINLYEYFINFKKDNQDKKKIILSSINLKKINNKNWKNVDEIIIHVLTKNKINVTKINNNEYICKRGNNKITLEVNKINNLDNYNISINNLNSNKKEFELFKKLIVNIFNSN